ncbi:MAG: SGNH/GDSL hydrolase family protein [Bacillales bacterium]|nr:SGNH/GDSL hydrolase family protein [Bacillales bacterium]
MNGNDEIFDLKNVKEIKESPIKNKMIAYLGSSVTYGYKSEGVSFVEYIAKRNSLSSIKEAVSGTTLVDNSDVSYYSRLKRMDKNIKIDLFVCQFSTNDAYMKYEIKDIMIALLNIVSYIKNTWGCPVIVYTSPYFESPYYENMVNELKKEKDKLEINLIDMYSDKNFNNIDDNKRNLYMADPVHPTKAGYLFWLTPYMENEIFNILK